MVNFIKNNYKFVLIIPVFILIYAISKLIFDYQIIDRFFQSSYYDPLLDQYITTTARDGLEQSIVYLLIRDLILFTVSIISSIKFLKFDNEKKAFFTLLLFNTILLTGLSIYWCLNNTSAEYPYETLISFAMAFLISGFLFFNKFKFK